MRPLVLTLYTFALAFWTGGIALFTFIVTPVIFRSYGRDQAGEIVGRLFPGYFLFCLAVAAASLFLFLLLRPDLSSNAARSSLVLLAAAVLVSAYVQFSLHPRTVRVKQQVATFEAALDSPARVAFRRLHAESAVLNLFLLLDGAALVVLAPFLKR